MVRILKVSALLLTLLSTNSCYLFKNRDLFDKLNEPSTEKAPDRPKTEDRIAAMVSSAIVDSYYEPDDVAVCLDKVRREEKKIAGAKPLSDLYGCLLRSNPSEQDTCYKEFFKQFFELMGDAGRSPTEGSSDQSVRAERDLIRLASNLGSAGANLSVLADQLRCLDLEAAVCIPDDDPLRENLTEGIYDGLGRARTTITRRSWCRDKYDRTKKTALVMSGGAADGAYIAGFIWSLLASYQEVPGQPNVDLVVGTSTGSLIGAVVDAFFTNRPTNHRGARDLLLTRYTKSFQKDLLCIVPGSGAFGMFGGSAKGLVRFDPLKEIVRGLVTKESMSNQTEFVTMTVDLAQGSLWPDSDQDAEPMTVERRVETVMASVVEPALAEPITLKGFPGRTEGLFIDGGLRSGLPVVQAVQRGAERVVALSASSLDPPPVTKPKNAGQILFRSLDLFVYQLRIAEAQQADGEAVTRRSAEKELCRSRFPDPFPLKSVCGVVTPAPTRTPSPTPPPITLPKAEFQPPPPPPPAPAAVASWSRGRPVNDVKDVWRSMWVFRGETAGASATNYEFHPRQMRPLFLSGVVEFRNRCREVLDVLAFPGSVLDSQCSDARLDKLVAEARDSTKPPEGGWPEKPPKVEDCR